MGVSLKTAYLVTTLLAFIISIIWYGPLKELLLSYNRCNHFYSGDESIQYPLNVEIVSTSLLFRVCFTSLIVVLITGEASRIGPHLLFEARVLFKIVINAWIYLQYILCGVYWSGLFLLVVKLQVGRLRPCFLEGCKLQLNNDSLDHLYDVSSCENFRYHYYCQSFFSGHAMMAFYCFMSISGYVYAKKMCWKTFYYINCFAISCWISFSRLLDNQHHASDIVIGAVVGCIFAFLSFIIANKKKMHS